MKGLQYPGEAAERASVSRRAMEGVEVCPCSNLEATSESTCSCSPGGEYLRSALHFSLPSRNRRGVGGSGMLPLDDAGILLGYN